MATSLGKSFKLEALATMSCWSRELLGVFVKTIVLLVWLCAGAVRGVAGTGHTKTAAGEVGHLGPNPHLGGDALLQPHLPHCILARVCLPQPTSSPRSSSSTSSLSTPTSDHSRSLWSILLTRSVLIPLQVSLGRMILDICKFCFLYLLVLFSFSCGELTAFSAPNTLRVFSINLFKNKRKIYMKNLILLIRIFLVVQQPYRPVSIFLCVCTQKTQTQTHKLNYLKLNNYLISLFVCEWTKPNHTIPNQMKT